MEEICGKRGSKIIMRTLKELNNELHRISKRIDELKCAWAKDTNVIEKKKMFDKASKDYGAAVDEAQKKIQPELDLAADEYSKIHTEIRTYRDSKKVAIPENVQAFLDALSRGTDWGPKGNVIKWISAGTRFVIITNPGHTGWCGIGMTKYYESQHYLYDLNKMTDRDNGSTLGNECQIRSAEGRLSKEVKNEWKKYAIEKENSNE